MGKAAFLHLEDRVGRIQLYLRRDTVGRGGVQPFQEAGGLWRHPPGQRPHVPHAHPGSYRRGAGVDDAGEGAQPAARKVARAERRRAALPRALRGPDVERGGARHLHHALAPHQSRAPLLGSAGFHRGGDPDPPAALRRRGGAPLCHPSQLGQARPVPPHRRRALPEAAHRRRAGARLRDRQGFPQRGAFLEAQPRIHDAGSVSSLR